MKISTPTAELLSNLQTVARVASTRSAIQALSGVQLVATESGVELRATDMEIGMRVPLQAEVIRPGEVREGDVLTLESCRSSEFP